MHCIVISRNGLGEVWRFFNLRAARLHPIPQMDDVYAVSADGLVEQYGKRYIDDLLRFAEGRDRARLVDAFAGWKDGCTLTPDIKELIWSLVKQAAATPPEDPAEVVRIIKEDRLFREDRILRSIGADERSTTPQPKPTPTRKAIDMAEARKRVDENSVITVKTEEGKNPKRPGSKAFDRFAFYQDGMTVRQAKAAGVQATDISYDTAHGFIELTPGEAPAEEAAVEGEGEEAPKKKKKKAA